jgi:hypothetical protein
MPGQLRSEEAGELMTLYVLGSEGGAQNSAL